MADSPNSFRVEELAENEWERLRDIRLSALLDDRSAFLATYERAFLATYEREATYDEQRWRQEFSRGTWNIMLADDKEIGLLGVTREEGMPSEECYLEYLWVAPDFRRSGVASMLLGTVLDGLRTAGVGTVWLYVLDGNEVAMHLYQGFGFQRTNERQLLPGHPAGSEERMKLPLD